MEIVEGGCHLLRKKIEEEKGVSVHYVDDDDGSFLDDNDTTNEKFLIILAR